MKQLIQADTCEKSGRLKSQLSSSNNDAMDEAQRFIRSLRFYQLTSQQRKTLRGQALAGNLAGAKAGLQKIVRKGIFHGKQNLGNAAGGN